VEAVGRAFRWKHREVATAVLRAVNALGYYVHSAIGTCLKLGWVLTIMGFNPMMQFIPEEDVAEAIADALHAGLSGIFNVVGPGAVPLRVAIRETGGTAVPVPEPLARGLIGRLFRLGLYPVPPAAVDFVKYPCTIDGRRFRDAARFKPLFRL